MTAEPRELVRIEGVTKRFGKVVAVDDVTLSIYENEFFALLGPSGCGKTTLLRILAGFETPDSGRVLLDGADLVGVKPYRRPLNMMFQSYALFPHMSVERNVAYGLEAERRPKEEIRERVAEALRMTRLEELASRRPAQLSGGQRQRVALARALVKRPRLLLLDEPLSALDRQIREEMQVELKRLQHAVGITFVVVTHDQEEALGLADRVAVMREGRVVQAGTPDELYERPTSAYVASFLGESNLLPGVLRGAAGATFLETDVGRIPVDSPAGLREGERAYVLIRPERLRVEPAARATDGLAAVTGTVAEVIYTGATRKLVVDVGGGRSIIARVPSAGAALAHAVPGAEVRLAWEPREAVVLAAEDGDSPNDADNANGSTTETS